MAMPGSAMFGNLTFPLIGTILIYFIVLILRNVHFPHWSSSEVKICSVTDVPVDRHVDISDSRLSNFGSASGPRLDSEQLTVDRVIPLTETLNKMMYRILKRFSLNIQLEEKIMIPLKDDMLNLTLTETLGKTELKRAVYGMNAVVTRLDTIQPLGNAYISEDSDRVLVITQRLRFEILKCKYDYGDGNMKFIGTSSLICNKNTFVLNVNLSTNYDNSQCKVERVDVFFTPVENSCYLKLEGPVGRAGFDEQLKSTQIENFITKVVPSVKKEIEPLLTKAILKEDICSYFDANDDKIDETSKTATEGKSV